MSSSMHIEGVKPPGTKWLHMKKIWDACNEGGVDAPKEVMEFFDYSPPDEIGVVVDEKGLGDAVSRSDKEMTDGYVIDLSKLNKDIKYLRVYMAY